MKEYQDLLKRNADSMNTLISLSSFSTQSQGLSREIESVVEQQINKAKRDVEDKTLGWKTLLHDKEMKLFRREGDLNGTPCDSIKACFTVTNITGYELCHVFFNPKYRFEWDVFLDEVRVVEEISDDTTIFMQRYKKFWFASQRDSVFWSHIKRIKNDNIDQWLVVNHSVDRELEESSNKCIRVRFTICLLCETEIDTKVPKIDDVNDRNNIKCKITYCATIDPGGWSSPSFLRPFHKKEYPRFLKRLTTYVKNLTKNTPPNFG